MCYTTKKAFMLDFIIAVIYVAKRQDPSEVIVKVLSYAEYN